MANTDLNFSNHIITTKDIEGLLGLLEGDGIFDFWRLNVAHPDMGQTAIDTLRRLFPRANYLREVILKLSWTIPVPAVKIREDMPDAEAEKLEELIKELMERRYWEGDKTFWAAVTWWRPFVFTTGDLCVKLPVVDGQVRPERMPVQNMYISMDPDVKKKILGFKFRYPTGTQQYTEQGSAVNWVIETIEQGLWTREIQGLVEELPCPKDFIPVAHMAWEEREDFPRGLPLMLRLADKALHVYTAALDRRLGNKMGSVPLYVLLNAVGDLPTPAPGAVYKLKTENPTMPADFKAVGTSYSDTSIRSEYVDAMRELYEEAFLPFQMDKAGNVQQLPSGKALQMLSADQVKYREAFQTVEGAFLEDLIRKALTLEGVPTKPGDFILEYESLVSPDPGDRRADAQFWLDAGLPEQAFLTMGKDEEQARKLAKEVEDKRAEELLATADKLDQKEQGLDG